MNQTYTCTTLHLACYSSTSFTVIDYCQTRLQSITIACTCTRNKKKFFKNLKRSRNDEPIKSTETRENKPIISTETRILELQIPFLRQLLFNFNKVQRYNMFVKLLVCLTRLVQQ